MAEARVYPVRLNGGPTMVYLSVDELIEAAEEGRLTVASGEGAGHEVGAATAPTAVEAETQTSDPRARRIEDAIAELVQEVPDEEWESLPPDLSEQHDHYIYGTPKR